MNFSLITLILSNLIPLAGILFWGWSLLSVMALYWMENVVIGLWNVVKILGARGALFSAHIPEEARERLQQQHGSQLGTDQKEDRRIAFFLAPFFLVHYGIFTLVHGVFVFSIFGRGASGPMAGEGLTALPQQVLGDRSMLIALVALVISHGVSFFVNFIGKGEYLRVGAADMMKAPYARIVVLHLTILLGGGAAMVLGEPLIAILLLVVLKTGVDIIAHRRSHRKLQPAALEEQARS